LTSHTAAKLLAASAISRARQHPDWIAGKLPPGVALIPSGGFSVWVEPGELILNVRDSALAIAGGIRPHSHSEDFEGIVLAGSFAQRRYHEHLTAGEPHKRQRLSLTHQLTGDPEAITLIEQPAESYAEGETYLQATTEIHGGVSIEPGTVTMVHRTHRTTATGSAIYIPDQPGRPMKAEPASITLDMAKVNELAERALANLLQGH
jgi:hypothetical protein